MTKRKPKYQGPIIAIRPRVGSALEALFLAKRANGESMSDALHEWAETLQSRGFERKKR